MKAIQGLCPVKLYDVKEMTRKERVLNAINHKKSDRVPKGETWIAPKISNKLLKADYPLDYLMTFGKPEDVKREVRKVIDIADENGGFILSTCNTMIDAIPPENVIAMMEEAEK